ncbi:MAG: hypothetical protein AB7K52_10970 [Phycisphaerales bacterium]
MFSTIRSRRSLVAGILIASGAASAHAAVDVIFSRAPQSPTSLAPGAVDENGNPSGARFLSMLDFWLSPDGTRFLMRGSTDPAGTTDNYVLLGSGTTGSIVLQESRPFPGAIDAEVVDFGSSLMGYPFNEHNQWAYSIRARGGSNTTFNKILRFDAMGNGELRFQGGNTPAGGSPYTGLIDVVANPSGDETVGNSTSNIHLLNDGRIGWQDNTVLNIHSSRRPVTAYDAVKYRQVNVDPVMNIDATQTFNMSNIASTGTLSVFLTSPDGSVAVLRGNLDTDGNGSTIPAGDPVVVVVNDQVRIQVGVLIPGSTVTPTGISGTSVAANSDWYARGTDAAGAWATRNGTVIARTGDSVGADAWGSATFFTIAGNSNGSVLIVGKTNNSDPAIDDVVAVDGQVVLREGDPVSVDLDGDGSPDTAFVGRGNNTLSAFLANNSAGLAPDGTVYILANLRDAGGADLAPSGIPYALLRITPGGTPCLADFNMDGNVDPDDLGDYINCYFGDPPCGQADFNNDGNVDPDDLGDFINTYFAGC